MASTFRSGRDGIHQNTHGFPSLRPETESVSKLNRSDRHLLERLRADSAYGIAANSWSPTEFVRNGDMVARYIGDMDRAEEIYKLGIQTFTRNPEIRSKLAMHLMWQERFEDALAVCDTAMVAIPAAVHFKLIKGEIFERMGRYQEAREIWLEQKASHPNQYVWWSRLINLCIKEGELGAALDVADTAAYTFYTNEQPRIVLQEMDAFKIDIMNVIEQLQAGGKDDDLINRAKSLLDFKLARH